MANIKEVPVARYLPLHPGGAAHIDGDSSNGRWFGGIRRRVPDTA